MPFGTLACDSRLCQIWADAESGLRVWGLDEVFNGWPGDTAHTVGRGEPASPCRGGLRFALRCRRHYSPSRPSGIRWRLDQAKASGGTA